MSSGGQLSGLDGFFANTNIILLIILAICCNPLALILSAIGYFTGKDPRAKQNALVVLIVSVVLFFLGGGSAVFSGYGWR
jgi:hypothetical protein